MLPICSSDNIPCLVRTLKREIDGILNDDNLEVSGGFEERRWKK